MVAMPVAVLIFILVEQVRPGRSVSVDNFLAPALLVVVIAPLVWGLTRRATWARVASLIANLGWGVFMMTLLVEWVRVLRSTTPDIQASNVGDVVISAVQVALAFFALVDLVWPRSALTSSAPQG
jgi:hypothetical protein